MHLIRKRRRMAGQSLAEFAISSIVLVLLFGGLVDLTRAIHYADVLQSAVREGARAGAAFDTGSASNSKLDDADIQVVVDNQLRAGGLATSVLKNPGCPAVTDGNTWHNPPFVNSAFPAVANLPWLYVCYDNNGSLDYSTVPPTTLAGHDLNVILLMAYGPLTLVLPTPLGGSFGLAASWHVRIAGG